jgi:hypothetical protein
VRHEPYTGTVGCLYVDVQECEYCDHLTTYVFISETTRVIKPQSENLKQQSVIFDRPTEYILSLVYRCQFDGQLTC